MNYLWKPTDKIEQEIDEIKQKGYFIREFPVPNGFKNNLRRNSTLKSSLFSARIEGNKLRFEDIENSVNYTGTDPKKLEVFRLLDALNYIYSVNCPKKLSLKVIQKLHELSLRNINPHTGKFRVEMTGIFNSAGVAVYLTPPAEEIVPKLEEMIAFINSGPADILIRAAVGHFAFEKIHPFVDGNGRVGRLISQFIIDNRAENFSGLLPFEEQIENSREVYYSLLANEGRDITEFVEYFLERLNLAADKIIGQLKLSPKEIKPEDTLLPRRKEIVQLLRDHHDMSFDQIHRRFFAIRPNTLRNDLRQLTKQKIIIKLGATRGVVYQYNRNN